MLIVHPSSVCDVCLEPYGWEEQARTPHAIPCGHIFCYSCLQLTTPSNCPLCRKAFLPQRIKKIHVDRFNGAIDDSSSPVCGSLTKRAKVHDR
ncbi:unnamed protein product [Somion occarium]|uniref:RING-type domain-containing protein n=1 Tax=Somion occarium TaxID=3059160 RepID=A0ABP1DV62_9APHY